MSFLGWVIGGVIGTQVLKEMKNVREQEEEENRRRNTPFRFDASISKFEFDVIVKRAGAKIKRIKHISADGPIVHGTVLSQSGISEWDFTLDFNDYGCISGNYWITSENDDSDIPERVAKLIRDAVINIPEMIDDAFDRNATNNHHTRTTAFCPYCSSEITLSDAKFCASCGKRLTIRG